MIGKFIKICRADDIDDGAFLPFTVDGHEIILARDGGQIYATANTCSHDGSNLGSGRLADGQLVCPRHGARFDIRTGQATRMPAIAGIETYDVIIENGDVYIALPE